MGNTINQYPFWSPEGAGAAKNFAAPLGLTSEQVGALISDSMRLRVPQEVEYSQKNLPLWQYVPAFVPVPQGPAQVRDPYTQARSLLDYARTTLGTSQSNVVDARGTEGQTGKTGK